MKSKSTSAENLFSYFSFLFHITESRKQKCGQNVNHLTDKHRYFHFSSREYDSEEDNEQREEKRREKREGNRALAAKLRRGEAVYSTRGQKRAYRQYPDKRGWIVCESRYKGRISESAGRRAACARIPSKNGRAIPPTLAFLFIIYKYPQKVKRYEISSLKPIRTVLLL